MFGMGFPRLRSRSFRATVAAAAAMLCAFFMLSGCARPSDPPADKAFARSASALSGSDRYNIEGVVSFFDPHGMKTGQSKYRGQVTGHGNLNLQWSGGPSIMAARPSEGPPAFQPLQLLHAMHQRSAQVSYADRQAAGNDVRLRIRLVNAAARERIAQGLRGELKTMRQNVARRKLDPGPRKQAIAVLDKADRNLATALSTLKVNTVCLWTADRRTWFPRQMREDTELAYTWNGQPYREKRVSVTHFRRPG